MVVTSLQVTRILKEMRAFFLMELDADMDCGFKVIQGGRKHQLGVVTKGFVLSRVFVYPLAQK